VPPLVMLHGWMDVGASFQFVVDALARADGAPLRGGARLARLRPVSAPRHRQLLVPDYLGDLDALLDALSPDAPVDLLGHSMGGNVVMSYAGVRPHASAAWSTWKASACPTCPPPSTHPPGHLAGRAEDPAAAETLRQPGRRGAAPAAEQPRLPADKALWLASALGGTRR
jgi:pimeloyl-ACP methyl ester carboxylesterase